MATDIARWGSRLADAWSWSGVSFSAPLGSIPPRAEPAGGEASAVEGAPHVAAATAVRESVPRVGPGWPVRHALRIMRRTGDGIVPVVDDDGRLVGVVTDHDLAIHAGEWNDDTAVEQVARDASVCVGPESSLIAAFQLMDEQRLRALPVVDEQRRLIGQLTLQQLAALARHDERTRRLLGGMSTRRWFWPGGGE